jgi:hypothetical protein
MSDHQFEVTVSVRVNVAAESGEAAKARVTSDIMRWMPDAEVRPMMALRTDSPFSHEAADDVRGGKTIITTGNVGGHVVSGDGNRLA